MFKWFTKLIKNSSLSLLSLVLTGLIIFGGFYFYMLISLPDVRQLKDLSMQVPLRVYSSDEKLISEFGEKKRIPITIEQVPTTLIDAILDTEDQRFYEHKGVDFWSLVRAAKSFIESGRKSQGASTITMQVARNFFLNRQKTFSRKINEILLAFKIDNTFSKQEILELYLNKIYFGNRAYGVAAAAKIYYGKTLDELSTAEMAMIAGLPQAPSRDNPIANPNAAKERRNHVLMRMLENDHLPLEEYKIAASAPIETNYHESKIDLAAPYVAEIVRSAIVAKYGDSAYESGLKVYTTIDSNLQQLANQALHDGVLAYDQRHGYRGPEEHLTPANHEVWQQKLRHMQIISDLHPAAVLATNNNTISALLADGSTIKISRTNFEWADPSFKYGDVIRAYKINDGEWRLAQLPEIEGAFVAVDPKDGAVLALNGGFSYAASNFNRVTQAERQTGSIFKPFIYSAAIAKGMTLATIINDAPVVLEDPSTNSLWRPQNDSQIFYGPISLRTALTRSRNLASIRVLQTTGIPFAVDYLKNFGFEGSREIPPALSLALGSGSTTPLKMAAGYAVFANGGYQVTPFVINKITETDKMGDKIIFQAEPATVPEEITTESELPPAPRVITEQNAYLITDALKDTIISGTARRAKNLNREDLAGKTGTTNDRIDDWFTGYNSDIVATVWLGFDQPRTTYEHGSRAALPIWVNFMQNAMLDKPLHSLKRPDDIVTVRIDPTTGLLAHPEQQNGIFEIFIAETEPTTTASIPSEIIDDPNEQEERSSEPLF